MQYRNKNIANKIIINRLLKIEKESNKKEPNKVKSIEVYTLFFSIIAIGVSLVTLYFQFFYEKNNLIANFVDFDIANDTTLVSKIVYHNKGNLNETVLANNIIFYQDSTKMEHDRIIFSKNSTKIIDELNFDPIVLVPGQQLYKELKQPFDFSKTEYDIIDLKKNDTIRIALQVTFINDYGFQSSNYIKVGWISLDENRKVEYWRADYQTKTLESDVYVSSSFLEPKKNN